MGKIKSETEEEVIRFIKILVAVVIIVVGAYFFTNKFVSNEYDIKKDSTPGEISPGTIIAGSVFNRPEEEYYVIAFRSKENSAIIYQSFLSLYEQKEDSIRIYFVDLDNKLNKDFYGEESNKQATNASELKMSDPTLLKIKSGKISKYIEGSSDIKTELGI